MSDPAFFLRELPSEPVFLGLSLGSEFSLEDSDHKYHLLTLTASIMFLVATMETPLLPTSSLITLAK